MATPPPSASSSKTQPIPWTHQETVHLIHAYQEKWYALERGQLKSGQWEEIAAAVAARCGYSSKTSVQCRHKMEKLRQRFRAEKRRLSPAAAASRWPYFDLINNLMRGPLPISSIPPSPYQQHHKPSDSDSDPDSNSDSVSDSDSNRSKSHTLRNRNCNREEAAAADEMCFRVAAEIGAVAEKLMGMESAKLEMMKEAEMRRMAMEKKRIQMILESEHKILNSISKAFRSPSPKRLKIPKDSSST